MPTHTVDLSGLRCPLPIVELNKHIKPLAAGDELVATATDPAFCLDVESWCKLTGHELVALDKSDDNLIATIRKKG